MSVNKVGPCRTCMFWRSDANTILAEAPMGSPNSVIAPGECRRRLRTGRDNKPAQPQTPADIGCAEHRPLPVAERYTRDCADCRYWLQQGETTEGQCIAFSPSFAVKTVGRANQRTYEFPKTPKTFYCGDGVSMRYIDPDEDD